MVASTKRRAKKLPKTGDQRIRRALRGSDPIPLKKSSRKLPTVMVADKVVAKSLGLFCAASVASKSLEAEGDNHRAICMAFALNEWARRYVEGGRIPDNFYLTNDYGDRFTYTFTSNVVLTEEKIEALREMGFDARETIGKNGETRWIRVASIKIDQAVLRNNRARDALKIFLGVLEKEGLFDAVDFEQKLNEDFFSHLIEISKTIKLGGSKARLVDKIKAVVNVLDPIRAAKNVISPKSQEECIRTFIHKKRKKE